MAQLQNEETSIQKLGSMQSGTQVRIISSVEPQMNFVKAYTYGGNWGDPGFPLSIEPNTIISFNHDSHAGVGSGAAIIYRAPNAAGERCAWALAWDAPHDPSTAPNKVCVIAGTASYIFGLTGSDIRWILDKSGTSSEFIDTTQKLTAHANIRYNSVTGMANVQADFGLIP